MGKANPMQIITGAVLFLIMAAIAATLIYQKLLGGDGLSGRAPNPPINVDQLNQQADIRGWLLSSKGPTVSYVYKGKAPDGVEWTIKS
jgi:hypothetical protein